MSSEVRASTRRRNGARSIKQKDVIDSDEEFWNQDAFADDEDDDSFDEDEFSDKGEVCATNRSAFMDTKISTCSHTERRREYSV